MARDGGYRRLSISAKQAFVLERQREPPVACPRCETQTTAGDLLHHLDRCEGARAPHPLAKWITWREALGLGATRSTMHSWVGRGLVRTQGETGDRRYLLRDLAQRLAARRARREFGFVNHSKPRGRR